MYNSQPGYSAIRSARATRWTIGDIMNGMPRDAADDNYNSFRPRIR